MEISSLLLILANVLLVIVTGFYAGVSYKMFKEMRREHEASFRPYVSVSPIVYPGNVILYLRIKNTGKTSAQKLRLTLDRDFYQFGKRDSDHNIRNFKIFTEEIESFTPEEEIIFALAQGFVIFDKNADPKVTPSSFVVTAEYNSCTGKRIQEHIAVDLKPYLDSQIPYNPLVSDLDGIKKILEGINDSIKALKM